MNNTVILFKCYYLNNEILKRFYSLKEQIADNIDLVLSYDNSRGDIEKKQDVVYHIYDVNKIVNMGYKYSNEYNPLWINPEYAILNFYLNNKQYKYYWIIDYDVFYNGNWADFINNYSKSEADLITTYTTDWHSNEKYWPWTASLKFKKDIHSIRRAFFAIYRFSNKALRFLNEKYKQGYSGFCEVLVPTLLYNNGYVIQDIGKKFYDGITFWHEPLSKDVELQPDKLYHPFRDENVKSYRSDRDFSLIYDLSLIILHTGNRKEFEKQLNVICSQNYDVSKFEIIAVSNIKHDITDLIEQKRLTHYNVSYYITTEQDKYSLLSWGQLFARGKKIIFLEPGLAVENQFLEKINRIFDKHRNAFYLLNISNKHLVSTGLLKDNQEKKQNLFGRLFVYAKPDNSFFSSLVSYLILGQLLAAIYKKYYCNYFTFAVYNKIVYKKSKFIRTVHFCFDEVKMSFIFIVVFLSNKLFASALLLLCIFVFYGFLLFVERPFGKSIFSFLSKYIQKLFITAGSISVCIKEKVLYL
jgi:hypothetical protein